MHELKSSEKCGPLFSGFLKFSENVLLNFKITHLWDRTLVKIERHLRRAYS